jgi:hypothetical protein
MCFVEIEFALSGDWRSMSRWTEILPPTLRVGNWKLRHMVERRVQLKFDSIVQTDCFDDSRGRIKQTILRANVHVASLADNCKYQLFVPVGADPVMASSASASPKSLQAFINSYSCMTCSSKHVKHVSIQCQSKQYTG